MSSTLPSEWTTKVESHAGFEPLDFVRSITQWLSEEDQHGRKSVAIVGHLPSLEKLATRTGVVSFQYAGVVRLDPKAQGQGYIVRWSLPPELV